MLLTDFLLCVVYLAAIGCLSFIVGRILPKFLFYENSFPFRIFSFEKEGEIYERIGIKSWQNKLPDMSKVFPSLMPSKKVKEESPVAIYRMVQETCVAEFIHGALAVLGFACIFIWKNIGGAVVSFLFLLGNIPFILVQRYNRPKLVRVYKKMLKREAKRLCPGGTLVLSCNTGEGHNSCARAIKEEYESRGEKCVMVDALEFVALDFSRFISRWHTRLYRRLPALFGFGYKYCEKHSAVLRSGGFVDKMFARGSENLSLYITEGGFHTVICTHIFAAKMLSASLTEHGVKCRTAFVNTDYTYCPGSESICLDTIFSPAESVTQDYIKAGMSEDILITSGIPVRKMFYSFSDRPDPFSKGRFHVLTACGSMGCGNIKKLALLLSRAENENFCLTVVCGTNKKLKKILDKQFAAIHNIRILGYVEDMSFLMDTADVFITKPGGISTTESAVKTLPMILLNAVPGCETYNLEYFVSAGCAVSAENVKEAARICNMLCASAESVDTVRSNMRGKTLPSAEIICNAMLSLEENYNEPVKQACAFV